MQRTGYHKIDRKIIVRSLENITSKSLTKHWMPNWTFFEQMRAFEEKKTVSNWIFRSEC